MPDSISFVVYLVWAAFFCAALVVLTHSSTVGLRERVLLWVMRVCARRVLFMRMKWAARRTIDTMMDPCDVVEHMLGVEILLPVLEGETFRAKMEAEGRTEIRPGGNIEGLPMAAGFMKRGGCG